MKEATHQRCQGCGEALYAVEDWTREMDRPPDERRWFCDAGCRARWFEQTFGWKPEVERVRTIRGVARPRCGCGALMVRYSGGGRWRCRCGKTKREPSTRPSGRPKKAKPVQ